ncbi:MAG TPA: carboxypeptidase-like regulatory domain-containing protein, partial [Planctomycetota bacterium]|nr:carboxypeptidase-like regulatory domain-containing protein [Planctomycetota bacterium]
ASLSGTVTDLAGAPLAGVTVRTDDTAGLDGEAYCAEQVHSGQKTVTDANGRFQFDDLPRGSTRLSAWKDGYNQMASILTEYEIPCKGPVEIKMDRSGTVRGKVTGAANPEPGQEIHVSIEPEEGPTIGKWGGGANCRPDGSFEFKGVPPGRYTLIAGEHTKHETRQTIELKPGETLEVELKLE